MNCPHWLDLSEPAILLPPGERQVPPLGDLAVLVSTEPDFRELTAELGPCHATRFFYGTLARDSREVSVAGPFIGAPYGVMLLESLVARGVRQVLVLGWCGALVADLEIGDILVPDHAFVDEGTSRHYARLDPDTPQSLPHDGLVRQLRSEFSEQGISCQEGGLWTTDAIYRETRKKLAWFTHLGARAVEMECSALFSAAAFHGVRIAAALVVSDSLAGPGWTPGFGNKRFKAGRRDAIKALLACVTRLKGPAAEPKPVEMS